MDEGMEKGMKGWRKKGLNYCFLSDYYFSLLIYMNCIFLILSVSLSLSLSHHGDLLTRDYSVYSGGRRRRRRDGGIEEEEEGEEGGGVRVVRRGSELLAQRIPGSSNPLCVASHVSRLFVW